MWKPQPDALADDDVAELEVLGQGQPAPSATVVPF
jgi:hypothetical protein